MSNSLKALIAALPILITACSSNLRITDETIFDENEQKAHVAHRKLHESEVYQQAYQDGVREVLSDMKGKMQATQDFVYEPAVIECGVMIPARVVGGVLIPEHEECVQMRKGAFEERAPSYLPTELGQ